MKPELVSFYRAPHSGEALTLDAALVEGGKIASGALVSRSGARFPIVQGVPDFTWPQQLGEREKETISFYDGRADAYDMNLPLTFSTFGEDEAKVREAMADRLRIEPGMSVLEIGSGTGRDSEVLARRLGGKGRLFCQDITRSMLERNQARLAAAGLSADYSVANASFLPFADRSFDAVFQFGGVGEFSDIAGFFREVVRVTRPGGRVVVGDESMPPWLRNTTFARVLTLTNPQFDAPVPLGHVPIEARDVNLQWIIGGTFFLLDFTVGEGEPQADIDFPIPGPRGGTHRSRYFGRLEGVKPETKALAMKARERLGLPMHDWLDALVRREAERVLKASDRDA
ncbi:MAG TPA: methyltransferase domain-containing protein [Acetobacteraceae bacterium]|nr:methyltransferase domain-containing protein [Acetobacteraceae bacterium]